MKYSGFAYSINALKFSIRCWCHWVCVCRSVTTDKCQVMRINESNQMEKNHRRRCLCSRMIGLVDCRCRDSWTSSIVWAHSRAPFTVHWFHWLFFHLDSIKSIGEHLNLNWSGKTVMSWQHCSTFSTNYSHRTHPSFVVSKCSATYGIMRYNLARIPVRQRSVHWARTYANCRR